MVVAVILVTTGGTTIVDMTIGGTTTEGKGSTTGGIEQFRLAIVFSTPPFDTNFDHIPSFSLLKI